MNSFDSVLRWMKLDRIHFIFFCIMVLVLGTYMVYPAAKVCVNSFMKDGSFSLQNYREFFVTSQATNLTALWHSIYISLLSVLFSALIGIPLAFFFHRYTFPGARLFAAFLILPFVLPPLIGVIAFMFLLGESGMIPRGLQALLQLDSVPFKLEGIGAILAVHAYSFYVYFYLFVSSGLAGIDASMEEAASTLGAGSWHRLRTVELPLLTPAIVGASLLVFMVSMASFSAPYLFAGGYRILSLQIYQSKLNGDMPMALTQTVVLASISFLFLVILKWYSERRTYQMAMKGTSRVQRRVFSVRQQIFLCLAGCCVTLCLVLPHLTIILMSFVQDGTWTYQILPPAYTTENYIRLITESRILTPVINSIKMATMATGAAVLAGIISSYVLRIKYFRGRYFFELLVMLPWALPGTVIAIFLLSALSKPSLLTGFIAFTAYLLPLSYFIRHLPILIRSVHAALSQLDESLEDASKNLGAGWWYTFSHVTLPLIYPGIVAGALLVFVSCLGEFISSILLYVPSNTPIAIEILSQLRQFHFGSAASYSVLLIVIISVTLILSQRLLKRESNQLFFS